MIRVGSRDSRLAVVQAEEVCRALGDCELITMKTTGDMVLDKTLDQVGGKGLFVKELDRALADHRVDLTVHSLKDVPMEQPDGLPLVAFTKRADARDALVMPESGQWDKTKPIGCSSARRRVQLKQLFPEIDVQPVRGNVQTRLAKLDGGAYGALVLAAAGLQRLGLEGRISRYFSPDEIIPAAGQGILAVQGRAGEHEDAARLVDDADARDCAAAERSFVKTLGGGCFAPVAAYAEVQDDTLHLRGLYVTADETHMARGAVTGRRTEAAALGRTLALQLRHQAEGEA
ncbi:hydroxymethylbilane synthase [Agathobaculum sp. Marseille-P7918]|uniref:hydroxymethylbilane synthase n=1 Tax=Agathobaculum sp. Marseille-P7918 TaxID=2479843 RepID=UPI000F63F2E6|nr:hydroxymethylbilane synthase [Agathobaculum sp. Marseille-P7918]